MLLTLLNPASGSALPNILATLEATAAPATSTAAASIQALGSFSFELQPALVDAVGDVAVSASVNNALDSAEVLGFGVVGNFAAGYLLVNLGEATAEGLGTAYASFGIRIGPGDQAQQRARGANVQDARRANIQRAVRKN